MNGEEPQKVTAALRALAASMESQTPPPELGQALRFAFRRRKTRRRIWALIGTAAAGMIIGAVFAQRDDQPAARLPVQQKLAPPATVAADRPAVAAERTVTPSPQPRPVMRRREQRRVEVVTEFFPLAGGDLLSPLDRGGMIRVQLPRSAVTVFGLPMNEARAGEAVKADVLVGEDGLARAIRFVQ